MKKVKCALSGDIFEVSDLEVSLRRKFGFGDSPPTIKPVYRFRHLGAFWPHWNLHKRNCDKSGKSIISAFRPDCAYPVWDREEWIKHADPPTANFDFNKSFFEQAWELFRTCPIPHTTGAGNQNCAFTADWWYSKNCYLSHSGLKCEDIGYSYRVMSTKDSFFSVWCTECELCVDACNSENCFETLYTIYCKKVQRSAFLYDCRNCSDCMFCFNLRNKKYCFGNQQLTKQEYEIKKKEWNFWSRNKYEEAKTFFKKMMLTQAWHKATQLDKCENSSGNYLRNLNHCKNTYFYHDGEDCCNVVRGGANMISSLDTIDSAIDSELTFSCCSTLNKCYEARFCAYIPECKNIDYSLYCFQCEDCFGCCGLVGKKFCIFNKQYTESEYKELKEKIIDHMSTERRSAEGGKLPIEWGQFFPGHFAPNPYDESWSSTYFPLNEKEKKELGFRAATNLERKSVKTAEIKEIPDSVSALTRDKESWLTQQVFWDEKYKRPFQIRKEDIHFCKKTSTPLPNCYYINRLQNLFAWMPFDGELRETTCAKSGEMIQTSWPTEYDGRILCEEEYLKMLN